MGGFLHGWNDGITPQCNIYINDKFLFYGGFLERKLFLPTFTVFPFSFFVDFRVRNIRIIPYSRFYFKGQHHEICDSLVKYRMVGNPKLGGSWYLLINFNFFQYRSQRLSSARMILTP